MIVESVSSKPVTTKFGTKNTYSFKADGDWYKCGFKKPSIKEGDEITFTHTEGAYGKEVDVASISVAGGSAPAPRAAVPTAVPKVGFPIAALDGQRSIIRQNCVTNARETFVAAHGGKPFPMDADVIAATIIDLARKFEAYATGDLDMAAAKAKAAKPTEDAPTF